MKKRMKKKLIHVSLILMLSIPGFTTTIEKILLEGNKKVSRDTFLFYMKSREKSVYSKDVLRQDFKSLWKTGFFENITIESLAGNGTDTKVVKIIVTENPMIASVTFKTGKKIKETNIREKLRENNVVLTTFNYYNPSAMKKTEKIIKQMLLDHGYNQGNVTITTKEDQKRQISLTIEVVQGPKTRIGEIQFPGLDTRRVSPSFLRNGMKYNKPHSLFTLLGSKDVFNKEKINQDLEAIKGRLRQKGFLEAKVGTPTTSMYLGRTVMGKIQQMLKINIPVEPGPQYKVGEVKVEGNKIIKKAFLEKLVTLEKGNLYNIKKRDKIIEDIKTIYGNLGYIFSYIAPVENLDPVKKIADLTLKVNEGEVAYVGKLEFEGNTSTKDSVLRREWLLREGARFNAGWLKTCITRMKQLGLVDIAKEPEFKPDPEDGQKMNIKVHVKELNRQRINFNVGASGFDGIFAAIGYSTQNFMGTGESLDVSFQVGTKATQYRLSFTEPYLFDLPANLGFSLYKTSADYVWYKRKVEGFSLSSSARIWRFFNASLGYSYQDVNISDVDENYETDPLYNLYFRDTAISSISPTFYYSTIDSPLFPTSGSKVLFRYSYSGGVLGGDVDVHRTKLQLAKFIPIGKRHTLGMQIVHQALIPFGGHEIPYYEKLYLGGEQSIRGYETNRISPRNASGQNIGGNKAFYFNLEYIVPFNQQLSAVLFYDLGNVYDFGQPFNLKNVYTSTGLELRVFVPMLNVPFRLIFAYNPRKLNPGDSNFVFRFAIGTSFN
ncbi:MAG: outer membrane protein assembly factor BamA [bacterium]|nr:outer membrane protein assembly factor BamA [bacterium]